MYRLMCVLCTCDLDDSTCLKFCSIQLHVIIVWWEMNFHWALEWERWRLGYHIPSPSGFFMNACFLYAISKCSFFLFPERTKCSFWLVVILRICLLQMLCAHRTKPILSKSVKVFALVQHHNGCNLSSLCLIYSFQKFVKAKVKSDNNKHV
jgi:hypothetical protein